MIIALKKDVRKEEKEHLIEWLESYGVRTHISEGEFQTVIGLVGDTTRIDTDLISGLDIVQSVTRISEPFKKANRKFHPDDTVVRVTDTVAFGGGHFQIIAGPCSVETEDQVETIAKAVQASGAGMLRGGAFKRMQQGKRCFVRFFLLHTFERAGTVERRHRPGGRLHDRVDGSRERASHHACHAGGGCGQMHPHDGRDLVGLWQNQICL